MPNEFAGVRLGLHQWRLDAARSPIVSPGGDLIVTWTVPGQYWYDWIGLYKVGDPNGSYISYEYTNGTSSGTVRFRAPLEPGWYEFRYLTNDDYYDAARTLPITVIGGSLQ
jgi:hypothetical protein